jgi:hypothetical protein
MRPLRRLRRTGQPHLARTVILNVCTILVLGLLAGAAVGTVAVKVFDLVPLGAFSHSPGTTGQSSTGQSSTGQSSTGH